MAGTWRQRLTEHVIRARVRSARLRAFVPVALTLLVVAELVWAFALEVEGGHELWWLRGANDTLALVFALDLVFELALSHDSRRELRARPAHYTLALLYFVWLVLRTAGLHALDAPILRLSLVGGLLTLAVVDGIASLMTTGIRRLRLRPSSILALSFLVVVVSGAGLLLSPRAVQPGVDPLTPIDALFTATSATCVTGLAVRDTGTELSRYGQVVVLGLIQIGGLGIMTLVAFFATATGRNLSIRDQVVLRETLQSEGLGSLGRMLIFIVASTLILEAAGAVGLYYAMGDVLQDLGVAPAERWFHAVFHSVSAYCNAGFALYSNSLGSFKGEHSVVWIIALLFVVGGLGFPVLWDLGVIGSSRAAHAIAPGFARRRRIRRRSLHVQTRIVLGMSLILAVLGAGLIALYDWNGAGLYGYSRAERVSAVAFTSLTCRTAGFNVPDTGALATGSLVVMCALMCIGGSPGSTAGGLKTTTLGIILARLAGLMRRREEIEAFGRTIPRFLIANAIGVATIAILAIFTFTLALLYTDPGQPLERALFEVASALGTAGLSTGITPQLSVGGKVALSLAMFAGRLGPLTIVLALAEGRSVPARYSYPTTRVMIG